MFYGAVDDPDEESDGPRTRERTGIHHHCCNVDRLRETARETKSDRGREAKTEILRESE